MTHTEKIERLEQEICELKSEMKAYRTFDTYYTRPDTSIISEIDNEIAKKVSMIKFIQFLGSDKFKI